MMYRLVADHEASRSGRSPARLCRSLTVRLVGCFSVGGEYHGFLVRPPFLRVSQFSAGSGVDRFVKFCSSCFPGLSTNVNSRIYKPTQRENVAGQPWSSCGLPFGEAGCEGRVVISRM